MRVARALPLMSLLLLALTGCATSAGDKATPFSAVSTGAETDAKTEAKAAEPPKAPAEETTFYAGTVQLTSPDGATPFGPARQGLARRTVNREQGIIVESVLDAGRLRTTTLTRQGETNLFDASDAEKTFSGTVTFTGPAWAWTGWTYSISMTDGSGTIEGSAVIDDSSLRTEKYFVLPDGKKQLRIVDDLKVVTMAEYTALLSRQLIE